MNLREWLSRFSVESYGIYYKLFIIFGLFFLTPVVGFLYFALKYEFLGDNYTPIFFITLLLLKKADYGRRGFFHCCFISPSLPFSPSASSLR